jgi:hypothetical protein
VPASKQIAAKKPIRVVQVSARRLHSLMGRLYRPRRGSATLAAWVSGPCQSSCTYAALRSNPVGRVSTSIPGSDGREWNPALLSSDLHMALAWVCRVVDTANRRCYTDGTRGVGGQAGSDRATGKASRLPAAHQVRYVGSPRRAKIPAPGGPSGRTGSRSGLTSEVNVASLPSLRCQDASWCAILQRRANPPPQ